MSGSEVRSGVVRGHVLGRAESKASFAQLDFLMAKATTKRHLILITMVPWLKFLYTISGPLRKFSSGVSDLTDVPREAREDLVHPTSKPVSSIFHPAGTTSSGQSVLKTAGSAVLSHWNDTVLNAKGCQAVRCKRFDQWNRSTWRRYIERLHPSK